MLKVLIVEDEDIIRRGLVHMVDWAKLGCCTVGEASDGKEGLTQISKLHPDIVVTDVKMPFMDGIEMLQESIAGFAYEALIISGYDEFEYARKAISLGVSDYLLKPIDMDSLSATIKKIALKIQKKRELLWYYPKKDDRFDREVFELPVASAQNKSVCSILEYIEAHYKEKICIDDASKALGMSSTCLETQLKKELRYTFNSYLNHYRILHSLDLLKDGSLKVYEIADAVGFRDYKYFVQVFKKFMGCSPREFYKAHSFEN